MSKLKMLHGKTLAALFPWDFKSVFVWHITCKILSFEFYPKAVFFECKFKRFHGPPLSTFKADQLDFRGSDQGKDGVKDSLA